jgi:hypothetical protein
MHLRPFSKAPGALLLAAALLGLTACGGSTAGAESDRHRGGRSIDHVFVVVLENYKAEDVTPAAAPYLTELARHGVTLDSMYGVDHASLSNYVAMTSGQTPNAKTKADCFQYDCIFEAPNDRNIGDQLEGAHLDWRAYLESMPAPCAHPTVSGSLDPYVVGYATRHNPFMYYRDVVGPDITTVPARCAQHDLPFSGFAHDLTHHAVGNYNLIVPDTCNDGHDRGDHCALPAADTWLSQNVPQILASPEYRHHGALIITFDESEGADTRGCCGNSAGGKIATVVLSPTVEHGGAHTSRPYNHYAVLRTVEDLFGLDCLGHACDASVQPFGHDIWTAAAAPRHQGSGSGSGHGTDPEHGHRDHSGRPDDD